MGFIDAHIGIDIGLNRGHPRLVDLLPLYCKSFRLRSGDITIGWSAAQTQIISESEWQIDNEKFENGDFTNTNMITAYAMFNDMYPAPDIRLELYDDIELAKGIIKFKDSDYMFREGCCGVYLVHKDLPVVADEDTRNFKWKGQNYTYDSGDDEDISEASDLTKFISIFSTEHTKPMKEFLQSLRDKGRLPVFAASPVEIHENCCS